MKVAEQALDILKEQLYGQYGFGIPDQPSKVLNKPYRELTDMEVMALMDIYHVPEETEPCAMCKWVAEAEVKKLHELP